MAARWMWCAAGNGGLQGGPGGLTNERQPCLMKRSHRVSTQGCSWPVPIRPWPCLWAWPGHAATSLESISSPAHQSIGRSASQPVYLSISMSVCRPPDRPSSQPASRLSAGAPRLIRAMTPPGTRRKWTRQRKPEKLHKFALQPPSAQNPPSCYIALLGSYLNSGHGCCLLPRRKHLGGGRPCSGRGRRRVCSLKLSAALTSGTQTDDGTVEVWP